ncbi:electron transfer flavoprotein subunit alpha/FixB family protein, partial [Streptomyces sp. NPDC059398]|uniref:electron transfer flavoprotein subunit alpha/FixB family protein n=1 Tax=Streptomyces sp. NPDC059398 TaxID=3346820 RepID=UPI0036CEF434
MAEVLVYVDHLDGAVRKPTLELLTLARRIGDPVAVALGAGAQDTAAALAEHGAVKVLTADAPEFADYLVVPKVDALQAAYDAVSPAAVLVPSSAEGKEIAARLAVRIGSGIITDATDLEAGDEGPVATQSAFAASFTTKSRVSQGTPVITVKPNSAAVEPAPAAGTVEALTVSFGDKATGTKVVSRTPRESTGRPDLTHAAIVGSGGPGVNGAVYMPPIEALAAALGAA